MFFTRNVTQYVVYLSMLRDPKVIKQWGCGGGGGKKTCIYFQKGFCGVLQEMKTIVRNPGLLFQSSGYLYDATFHKNGL